MTKKFKKILFFAVLLSFCICTPVLILYSQGYRYDFQNYRIVQTGGLFFNISPPASRIYINNKLSKKTNFIFGSAFLSGLLPKNYEIKIEKEGYHSWQKTVKVNEQRVTEYKNIHLFSKDPHFSLLSSQIAGFYVLPSQRQLLLEKETEYGWALEKMTLHDKNPQTMVTEKDLLEMLNFNKVEIKKDQTINLQKITFSSGENRALIEATFDGQTLYFVLDLTDKRIYPISVEGIIKKPSFNPQNNDQLFFIGSHIEKEKGQYYDQELFTYDYKEQKRLTHLTMPRPEEKIISYKLINNTILWLNDLGFLYKGQFKQDRIVLTEILNLKPLKILEGANYKIITDKQSRIFVQENELLFYLDQETRLLTKIFASLKELSFSDDDKKICLRNDHEIIVNFLEEQNVQPLRTKGERVRLLGVNEMIGQIFWLNNHYLIFSADNSIRIIEIDDRGKPNLIELTTFNQPKINWLQKQKSLLVLSSNKLFLSKDILQ